MKYTQLGNTSLHLSQLGVGTTTLGNMFGELELKEACNIVKTAFDLGMNWIDTSPYYGITKAESVLGEALKHLEQPREKYYIATKVGRYGADSFDFSKHRVIQSVDESLKRMGIEYIDLIQTHDIEFTNLDQIINETLPALAHLKESGKVRHIGITGYPMKIFKYILEHDKDHIVDSILSYCHYNLQNTTLLSIMPFLKERKVGIINASPLSMGLLTVGGSQSWHPAPQEIKDACAKAAAHCTSKGESIEKLGVQFALANPDIQTTLTGSKTVDEIRTNVQWLNELDAKGLNEELLAEVQEILKPVMNKSWTQGKLENND